MELTRGVGFGGSPTERLPVWLPSVVGDRLPDAWQFGVEEIISCRFLSDASDAEVLLVSRIPQIAQIDFDNASKISDAAIQTLIEAHDLESLVFRRPRRLTKQQLDTLAHRKKLESLQGVEGFFDQASLDALAQMQGLNGLGLVGPISSAARIDTLGQLPEELSLYWEKSQATDKQLSALAACLKLDGLWLYDTQVTAESWRLLGSLKLWALVLESPHIDDQLAAELVMKPELMHVGLRGGRFSDCGLKKLLESGVGSLEIETRNLSPASAKQLTASELLHTVTLRGGPEVNDEWLKELAQGDLFNLHILGSSITDAGVEHLKGCESIRQLALPNSQITDRSMTIFSTLKHLDYLDLRNTAITDEGLRQYFLAAKTRLQGMHVGGTQVTRKSALEHRERKPFAGIGGIEEFTIEWAEQWLQPLKGEELP